jgi:hypothetical protein
VVANNYEETYFQNKIIPQLLFSVSLYYWRFTNSKRTWLGVFNVMENTNLIKRTRAMKENFLIAHNKLVQNKNMSFQAKGLLVMLLSLPSDWVLHKSWIMKEYKIGRDKLNSMFNELKENGYLIEVEMIRKKGKFVGMNYMIYDEPQNNVKEISPMYQNPSTANPHTAEPHTVNGTTTKNISLHSTEKKKENTLTNSDKQFFSFFEAANAIEQGANIPRHKVTEEDYIVLVKTYGCDADGNVKNLPF